MAAARRRAVPSSGPGRSGGKDSCYNAMLCQRHGHEVRRRSPADVTGKSRREHSCHRLLRWPIWPLQKGLVTSWTATCIRLWVISWWQRTRSVPGCHCFACIPLGAPATWYAFAFLCACLCHALAILCANSPSSNDGQASPLQGLAYSETSGDEVEDLFCLLSYALAAMPELCAVASGAIASDYQRLRVENVRRASGPVPVRGSLTNILRMAAQQRYTCNCFQYHIGCSEPPGRV